MSIFDKIGQAVQKAQIVLQFVPVIAGIVNQVEQIFPQGGAGAQKLEAVRTFLESVYGEAGDIGIAFGDLWPRLQTVVTSIVATANALGLFKKGQPAAPTAPVTPAAP